MAERAEEEKWLAAIVLSSHDAIIFKDLNGIIKTWNRGAERIFGYKANEIIGKRIDVLIPPDRQDEEREILARIRRGEQVEIFETFRRRKNGNLVIVSLGIFPVRDADGQIVGAAKVARDITIRKKTEQQLADTLLREKMAREEVEAIGRSKDHFLAVLSHELRTPINPVLLIASDAATDPDVPANIREKFDTILQNVEVQVHLIDDLLELSRINHGKLRLNKQGLDAHQVLRRTIDTVRADLGTKDIQILIQLNAKQHLIAADSVRLQQVFWNILRNAIKFTPTNGKITIETVSRSNTFVVNITDTGVGMTPDDIERAFLQFSQGDSAKYQQAGLGLGLAISKRLVELHSGNIRASSDGRGLGSSFTIEFPLDDGAKDKA